MEDFEIIDMYKKGYSIKFISRKLYRIKNKNNKATFVDGRLFFENKPYTMGNCRVYVTRVIYKELYKNKRIVFSDPYTT